MSEKTLGEFAREAFKTNYGYCSIPWESCSPSFQYAWQAAADAIAAPLLARIAELEGERDQAQEANAHLISELRLARKGFEAVDQMRVEALSDAEAAYQRGAAEERERWKNAAISEKAKYGVDHDFNCGARTACDNILDVWRSASPAVDVTSDKGGER